MSQSREFLNRLRTDFQCAEPWEKMQGGDSCRRCGDCQRNVFDFAQMPQREIRARLEAGRGRLCARLTREGGRLLVLPAADPLPSRYRLPAKASPLAATLLGAWLGVGAAGAQPSSPPRLDPAALLAADPPRGGEHPASEAPASGNDAVLAGQVVDEDGRGVPGTAVVVRGVLDGRERKVVSGEQGIFVFENLPGGLYDLRGYFAGFEIGPVFNLVLEPGRTRHSELRAHYSNVMIETGIVVVPPLSLHQLFDESELVVAAVVEDTRVVEGEYGLAEALTRLRIERRFKGDPLSRTVIYRHAESLEADDEESGEAAKTLEKGDLVLALLARSQDAPAAFGKNVYERADYSRGVRILSGGPGAAYLDRIEALAELERAPENGAIRDPAELVEWLVDTAANPDTRGEVTSDLETALKAVAKLAKEDGVETVAFAHSVRRAIESGREGGRGRSTGEDLRPIVLGAFLSAEHQQRLTEALRATRRVGEGDRTLFRMVRSWDEEAAQSWLLQALRGAKVEDAEETYWWLRELAEERRSGEAEAFSAAATERWRALGESEAEEPRRRAKAQIDLVRELMRELAALLASERS